jgi:hypothetical protein
LVGSKLAQTDAFDLTDFNFHKVDQLMSNIADRVDVNLQPSWVEHSSEARHTDELLATHETDGNVSNLRMSSPAKQMQEDKSHNISQSETKPRNSNAVSSVDMTGDQLMLHGTSFGKLIQNKTGLIT